MRLQPGESTQIEVWAEDYYSRHYIELQKGEVYSFKAEKKPKWVDWFIPCTADGFWNIILSDSDKRVRKIPCFKLCGTIGQNEDSHFVIGSQLENFSAPADGRMYFFANDHYKEKFYKNNKKFILLNIKRIS